MLDGLMTCSLFQSYAPSLLMSHMDYRADLFSRSLDKVMACSYILNVFGSLLFTGLVAGLFVVTKALLYSFVQRDFQLFRTSFRLSCTSCSLCFPFITGAGD